MYAVQCRNRKVGKTSVYSCLYFTLARQVVSFKTFLLYSLHHHTLLVFRIKSDFAAFYFSGCEGDECNRGQTSSSSSSVKSQPPSKEFLGQFTQVSSPNRADHKHRDASAVLPFIGLTASKCTLYYCTS